MSRKIVRIMSIFMATAILAVTFGCATSSNTEVDAVEEALFSYFAEPEPKNWQEASWTERIDTSDLIESNDGYIHLSAAHYHALRNQTLDSFVAEVDEKFDGKKFAIHGTLRYAFSSLDLYDDDDRAIKGGANFDYSSLLRELGIRQNNSEYDGKDIIIRGTFVQGDMIPGFNFRYAATLIDLSYELVP